MIPGAGRRTGTLLPAFSLPVVREIPPTPAAAGGSAW